MIFRNLITFTTFFAFILSGFVCSAVIDSAHTSLAIRAEEGVSLESRQGPGRVPNGYCIPVPGWSWGAVDYSNILAEGIPYLNSLNPVTNPCNVGPTSCTRVSCSYDSAIYLCNDNNNEIRPPCSTVANMAQSIAESCWYWNNGEAVTGGQQFSSDGHWNVILRWDSC